MGWFFSFLLLSQTEEFILLKYLNFFLLALSVLFYSNIAQAAINSTSYNWNTQLPAFTYAKVKTVATGPTLIFSDSPEMVPNTGIMYQDTVSGAVRLFFHHVNDTPTPKRIAIILENPKLAKLTLKINKQALSKPNLDYLAAGKEVQEKYFSKHQELSLTLNPLQKYELLSHNQNGIVFQSQELVHGMYELQTDGPITVKVICLPLYDQASIYADIAKILPPDDQFLRGTFPLADRQVTLEKPYNPKKDGVIAVILADNKQDAFARGFDPTINKPAINYGNYGVIYNLNYRSEIAEIPFAIRLNSYGGSLSGHVVLENNASITDVAIPQVGFEFGKTWYETIPLASYKNNNSGKIIFSPPGAGNLPVRFFFYPEK